MIQQSFIHELHSGLEILLPLREGALVGGEENGGGDSLNLGRPFGQGLYQLWVIAIQVVS